MIMTDPWQQELTKRRSKIWSIIVNSNCDIGLIYSSREYPEPFRYLTNFVPTLGDMWGILVNQDQMTNVLNFHWELNEARQVSGLNDWHGYFDPLPFLREQLLSNAPKRIGVLGLKKLPWQIYTWLVDTLKAELVDIDENFNLLRRIKNPFEIEILRKAVQITDLAIEEVKPLIKPGSTEIEIAAALLHTFHKNNADSAFFPLVMGGTDADTAVIARKPRSRPLEVGDTVMLDIGAAYQGYQADVARTFVIGKPTQLQQHVWDTVCRAHEVVLKLAKPGTPCLHLHKAAQKVIEDAGHTLDHRIGHGYGLATSFEWPSLDTETAVLEPGMTLAIEPAIYTMGAGAMKLEDCILITDNGCEVLSTSLSNLDINMQ